MANPRWMLQNWRRFVFLKGLSTKTYLMFYTGITKREISTCLHNLFFGLCKVLFLTSFCREYCEQVELNFGKIRRFISKTYLSKITSFTFYISILDWDIQSYHWTLSLQNFWGRMHKGRRQLVTWKPHHHLRVAIKFKFLFFVTINP